MPPPAKAALSSRLISSDRMTVGTLAVLVRARLAEMAAATARVAALSEFQLASNLTAPVSSAAGQRGLAAGAVSKAGCLGMLWHATMPRRWWQNKPAAHILLLSLAPCSACMQGGAVNYNYVQWEGGADRYLTCDLERYGGPAGALQGTADGLLQNAACQLAAHSLFLPPVS